MAVKLTAVAILTDVLGKCQQLLETLVIQLLAWITFHLLSLVINATC